MGEDLKKLEEKKILLGALCGEPCELRTFRKRNIANFWKDLLIFLPVSIILGLFFTLIVGLSFNTFLVSSFICYIFFGGILFLSCISECIFPLFSNYTGLFFWGVSALLSYFIYTYSNLIIAIILCITFFLLSGYWYSDKNKPEAISKLQKEIDSIEYFMNKYQDISKTKDQPE